MKNTPTHFRIGPLGAVGWPHVATIGLAVTTREKWGGEFMYGKFGLGELFFNAVMTNVEGKGHWFPWNGLFYLGLGMGHQSFSVSGGQTIEVPVINQRVGAKVTIRVDVDFARPHLGWQKVWDNGFLIATEWGYQANFSAYTRLVTEFTPSEYSERTKETEAYKRLESRIEKAGNWLGSVDVPYAVPLKVGWVF